LINISLSFSLKESMVYTKSHQGVKVGSQEMGVKK